MKTSVMKLTPEQVNDIKRLVGLGYMDSEIAKIFGNVTAGSIYYWRKKLGIKSTFNYEKVSKMDHKKMEELFNAGLSDYKIAKELNVKPCSVFSYRKQHNIGQGRNLKYSKPVPLSSFQIEVIIGIMFGDGSMRRTNTNARFICMHGIKQKDYCEYKYNLLSNLGATIKTHKRKTADIRTGIFYEDCTLCLAANPELNLLYESFYPNGRKAIPFNLLDKYSEVSLAFHYMDDGNKMKNGYCLATENFSQEDNIRFVAFLKERFGLNATLWRSNTIYIKKNSALLFKSLVEPYFCESMKYKL